MEDSSTDNTKLFDSGYSNTCSNSQSQRSSDSSQSKDSNQSESSSYCHVHPSTSRTSNEALLLSISERKEKEHKKKKKSKTISRQKINSKSVSKTLKNKSYSLHNAPSKASFEKKAELMDGTTYPGKRSNDLEAGLGSRTNPPDESNDPSNGDFYVLISMSDGLVVFTTISSSTPLGYSKEDWLGKSFINFIRPDDKPIFIDRVNSIAMRQEEPSNRFHDHKASLVCGLQRNSETLGELKPPSLQYKLDVSDMYVPYQLSLTFDNFRERPLKEHSTDIFLSVSAQLIRSAYKVPEETISSSKFTTQHLATCHMSYVDQDAVRFLGYLPQDMIGRSVFDFYHPEDMSSIKEIYETVVKLDNALFKSKPYRFIVQNGGCVVLETVWSRFINPWTKKLEFVIGQHRVLKGPLQPDVFQACCGSEQSCLAQISKSVLTQAKTTQVEIMALFNEENGSVMLGAISPHHGGYDGKSSTETMLSYNQLNYNENMDRFFKSSPQVFPRHYGSSEEDNPSAKDKNANAGTVSKANTSGTNSSAENSSSDSNNRTSRSSNAKIANAVAKMMKKEIYKQPLLTELLLNKHNEDMEKLMIQKHKVLRSGIKNTDKYRDSEAKPVTKKSMNRSRFPLKCRGAKRSRSQSRERDDSKMARQDDGVKARPAKRAIDKNGRMEMDQSENSAAVPSTNPNRNFAATSNLNPLLQQLSRCATFLPMQPVYYVPVQPTRVPLQTPEPNKSNVNPSFGQLVAYPAPLYYVTPAALPSTNPASIGNSGRTATANVQDTIKPKEEKRWVASQASSVKAKIGSNLVPSEKSTNCSNCPACLVENPFPRCVESCRKKHSSSCDSHSRLGGRRHADSSNIYESSSSSINSSFFSSSCSSVTNSKQHVGTPNLTKKPRSRLQIVRKDPPWLDGVKMTTKLIYEYQVDSKSLEEVLQADMNILRRMPQSPQVNNQLDQLYLDLKLNDFNNKLVLNCHENGSDVQDEWTCSDSEQDTRRNAYYL